MLNILLVEDSNVDAELYKIILEKDLGTPHILHRVKCLGEAISEVNSYGDLYDLVLLDLNLDDSRGIYTIKAFRKHCLHLPIIILSGMSDDKTIRDALAGGADSFIVKGEDPPKIMMEEITHVLENNKYKVEARSKRQVRG